MIAKVQIRGHIAPPHVLRRAAPARFRLVIQPQGQHAEAGFGLFGSKYVSWVKVCVGLGQISVRLGYII